LYFGKYLNTKKQFQKRSNFRFMKPQKSKKQIIKEGDHPFEIPAEGSLGILALGARGIIEWRKVREASNRKNKGKK
jgi:hypothetical protein